MERLQKWKQIPRKHAKKSIYISDIICPNETPPSLNQLLRNDKPGISSEATGQMKRAHKTSSMCWCMNHHCVLGYQQLNHMACPRGRRLTLNDFRRNLKVGLKCLTHRDNDISCAQWDICKIKKPYLVSRGFHWALHVIFGKAYHNSEGVNWGFRTRASLIALRINSVLQLIWAFNTRWPHLASLNNPSASL